MQQVGRSEGEHEAVREEAHEVVHEEDHEAEHVAVHGEVLGVRVEGHLGVGLDADAEDLVERMQDSREELVRQEVPEVVLGEDLHDQVVVLRGLLNFIFFNFLKILLVSSLLIIFLSTQCPMH